MLSTPFTLPCGATLSNRLAKAAMTERLSGPDYQPNALHRNLYRSWSLSGAGLLISGNVMVDRRYLESGGNVAIEDEMDLAAVQEWTDAGCQPGQHLWAQISHPGRQCSIMVSARPLAPSAVKLKKLGLFARPRAMTEAEIEDVIHRFARTAVLCKRGGFTGVQVHSAHGYLLSQFLSPLTNHRTDQWGGSLENRARLLLAIVQQTREAVGPDYPIGVKLNSSDFQRGGFTEEEALEVTRMLSDAGVDLLEISGGTYEHLAFFLLNEPEQRDSTRRREAYFLEFARKVRAVSNIPLMVTGGFRTRAFAETVLQNGELDLVGLARPFLTEPGQVAAFLQGSFEQFSNFRLRTGWKKLDDMAEGGFYARLLIQLARGERPVPDNSPLRSAWFLAWHEFRKGVGKRVDSGQ